MVILNTFVLELVAVVRAQLVIVPARGRARGATLMVDEKGLAVVRARPVRAAGQLHLEHTEIDAELQFFAAIEAENLAHLDVAALVRPVFQERVEVEAHVAINCPILLSLLQSLLGRLSDFFFRPPRPSHIRRRLAAGCSIMKTPAAAVRCA